MGAEWAGLEALVNAFCPTGKEGGVDPHCKLTAAHVPMTEEDNAKEANAHLPEESRPKLVAKEIIAIRRYSYLGDGQINQFLRDGTPIDDPKDAAALAGLRSAFGKLEPFKDPVAVHRSLQLDADARKSFLDGIAAAQESGTPIAMKGFSGTTTHPPRSDGTGWHKNGNVVLNIEAKYGLDMKQHSQFPGERELLLDEGSTFRVKGVRKVGLNTHVDLEQVNTGPAESPGGFRGWFGRR